MAIKMIWNKRISLKGSYSITVFIQEEAAKVHIWK